MRANPDSDPTPKKAGDSFARDDEWRAAERDQEKWVPVIRPIALQYNAIDHFPWTQAGPDLSRCWSKRRLMRGRSR